MNTQHARQQWFQCFGPDGLLTRAEAVNLIRKHASKTRVFEDLEGYPALMVADKGARQLVLFTDLSDAQIRHELPTAWLREHQQVDMFRDAAAVVANDERHSPGASLRAQSVWDKVKRVFTALCN